MQPKLFTFAFLALSLGLVPSLNAQSSVVTFASPFGEIESAIDASIFKLKVDVDVEVMPASLKKTTDLVDIWINKTQGACYVRARTQNAIDELVARATRAGLHFLEVEQFQEQIIEARLDRELDAMLVEMMNGELSPGRYQRATTLLQQRADAAMEDIDAPRVRVRLQSALDDLLVTARSANDRLTHFSRFYATLVDARLQRALSWLQFHAAARQATRQEYERVQNAMIQRAEAQAGNPPHPCD